MCGIFGAVFVRDATGVDVDAALASIRHRGPDRSDVLRVDGAILGHTRLSILDLTEAAAQPMQSEDGSVAVVFNGEIYNHHELRKELAKIGHSFRTRSDTEVIVAGYQAWGDAIVERLDGMFAIGIYDVPGRRLLLARDRPGKKPLFYARREGEIRFASEAKAIIASGYDAEVDVQAFPMLLTFGYTVPPRTMYRGISQLAPATRMILETGAEPRSTRYWRAPFADTPLEPSVEEATREVRRLTEEAVERRLEADVPLGAFLSGGVDSSIVVGVMAKKLGRKVRTFSIGFSGDARYDETHYARVVAKRFDTDHTEFIVDPRSFDLIERLVHLHDGPFGDSSAIPTSIVSMLTRKHVTVALTGDGGDELFCGYPRFIAAEAAEAVPPIVRRVGRELSRAIPGGFGERTLPARARRFLGAASLPLADRMLRWNTFFAFDLPSIVRPEILSQCRPDEARDYNCAVFDRTRAASTLARVLDHNFEMYLPYDLLVKADRASMMHGLELRSPFLDTSLIDYVARLPDAFKRRGTHMKWVLKRAFEDVLPPEILTRGKMGFGVPLGTWFRGGLRSFVDDHFAPRSRLFAYLDETCVRSLFEEHVEGRSDHSHRIWLLLTMQIWLQSMS